VAINVSSQFPGELVPFLAKEILQVADRQLVAYKLGDHHKLPKGRGLTYTMTRFKRFGLPQYPLSEGVPADGQTLTYEQVSGTCNQWGIRCIITDRAELVSYHSLVMNAKELMGLQISELLDRNTFVSTLMAGTQINYVNSRNGRNNLVAGDVLDTTTCLRTMAALADYGAPQYDGQMVTDEWKDATSGQPRADSSPRVAPHYVAIVSNFVAADLFSNSDFKLAASYSAINKLYNGEIGEWVGLRFCRSNMVPSFTGIAQVNGSPGTSGSLAGGTYYVIVTANDTGNGYEGLVAPVSSSITVVGPNGSINVTTPSTPGYTWNIYVGTSTTPTNLGVTPQGPLTGPMTGQATLIPSGTVVTITGVGVAQSPPAPTSGTGVTVWPTFVLGRGAYGIIELDDVKVNLLFTPEKTDPHNQQRVIAASYYNGSLIKNNAFFARIESTSAYSGTYT